MRMDKFLGLVALLAIAFGVIALADGILAANTNAPAMIGAWPGAYIIFSGVMTFVFAEILTVLKDIRKAVTRP
jgi:hypothetical protein